MNTQMMMKEADLAATQEMKGKGRNLGIKCQEKVKARTPKRETRSKPHKNLMKSMTKVPKRSMCLRNFLRSSPWTTYQQTPFTRCALARNSANVFQHLSRTIEMPSSPNLNLTQADLSVSLKSIEELSNLITLSLLKDLREALKEPKVKMKMTQRIVVDLLRLLSKSWTISIRKSSMLTTCEIRISPFLYLQGSKRLSLSTFMTFYGTEWDKW